MGQVNRISQEGLELVKSFEGLRRRSSRLPDGRWIVGFGHTRSAREGIEVSEREAEYLLRYDLQETERLVADSVRAPLHQNEFDALVSLAWNIGEDAFRQSDVLKYVNSGEMLAAAESFSAWRKARVDGHLIVLDALVRRRAAEKNLFLSHPSGAPAAPSLVVRPELDSAASVLALSNGALSLENKRTEEARAATMLPAADPDLSAANSNSQNDVAEDDIVITSEDDTETIDDESSRNDTDEDDIDPEDIEATTEAIGNRVRAEASIWDASDAVTYEELDSYDDVEDDDDGIDDTLLAAAIAASNLSRRDDEAEDDLEDDPRNEAMSDLVDLDVADDEGAEPDMLPDLEAEDRVEPDEVLTDAIETEETDEVQPLSLIEEAVSEADETEESPFLSDELQADDDVGSILDEAESEDDDNLPVFPSIDGEEAESEAADEIVETVEETDVSEVEMQEATDLADAIEDDESLEAEPATLLDEAEEAADEEIVSAIDDDAEPVSILDDAETIEEDNEPDTLVEEVVETTLVEETPDAVSDTEGEIWQEEAETAEEAAVAEEARRVTIVDPLVSDHYPGEDNGVDADSVHAPVSGGRKTAGDFWFGVFPFILLALLGAAMCVFGVMDWGGLIRSENPVSDNQLYAGPFLTLIGGFGLIFGVYFMIRKLSGVED